MTRTTIDLDDEACELVMQRFGLTTKRDAVNFALRHLAVMLPTADEARALRGIGWDGDLDELRRSRGN